ncbi:MAG: hypothetical protein QOE36_1659 [Gaiellaceae bacterium]|nr:hypothetical protein [Gaiellaceae bacterium]
MVAALASFLFAEPASAAPAWLPPVQLAGPQAATTPDVASDPVGDAAAVWDTQSGAQYEVHASLHRAGSGAWNAPDLLATSENPASPRVAMDAAGDALVVWTQWHDGQPTLSSSFRRAGDAAWGPVQSIVDTIGAAPSGVFLSFDGAGNALVCWVEYSDTGTALRTAYRPAAAGAWQAPVEVPAGLVQTAALAVGVNGEAVLAWSKFDSTGDGTRYVVQAALGSGGTWSAHAELVSSPGFVTGPAVTVDARGEATVAWSELDGGNTVIWAASRPPAGTWQPRTRLSFADGNASFPDLGSDAKGDVLAVWSTPLDAESSFRPVGGDWERAVAIPGSGPEASPALAMNARGDAVAVWPDYIGGTLRGAARPAGGTWQTAADVGPFASFGPSGERIAMDAAGDAVVVWNHSGEGYGEDTVLAAAYDAAGPVLKVTAPTSGVVLQPLTFTVKAVDAWSRLSAEPGWTFSDGRTAGGASVTRAFASPGTYTATVVVSDAAGNTSSAKVTVVVTARAKAAPSVLKRPSIRGVPRVGKTLTCVPGKWRGTKPIRFAYAWLRDGRSRAAGARLRLRRADAGHRVLCTVKATNAAGTARTRSLAVRVRR